MKASRINQLISATDAQIYNGYVDVIKGCIYGKPRQGYSAFTFSCVVASSRVFPHEIREFARIISNPSNEALKYTVSRMIINEEFCSQVKNYFEAESCECEDIKSVMLPLATVIEGYLKKNKCRD